MKKDLKKINDPRRISIVFDHSLIIGFLILALGLALDWKFGSTWFQRSGAFVVGYAIVSSFELSRIQDTITTNVSYLAKQPYTHLVELDRDPLKDQVAMKAISQWLTNSHSVNSQTVPGMAEAILTTIRLLENNTPKLYKAAEELRTKEIILGVLGTVIWAVGDWIANFIIHCGEAQCIVCGQA